MPTTIERPSQRPKTVRIASEPKSKAPFGTIVRTYEHSKAGQTLGQIEEVLSKRPEADAQEICTEVARLLRELDAAQAPQMVLPELHDPATGRIDAQKVADFMGVPLKQLSEGLGLNYKAVHRNPCAPAFQKALIPVKSSLEYLKQAFPKPEVIRAWLNTPHPMLEGKTSLETILEGKSFAIVRLLGNAWEGVVS